MLHMLTLFYQFNIILTIICKSGMKITPIRLYTAHALKKISHGHTPKEIALEYFDVVYGSYFGNAWPSIRLGLLSPKKFALLYNKYAHNRENIDSIIEARNGSLKSIWDILNLPDEFSEKCNTINNLINEETTPPTIEKKIYFKNNEHEEIESNISEDRLHDFSHIPPSEIVDIKAQTQQNSNTSHVLPKTSNQPLNIIQETSFYLPKNINFFIEDFASDNFSNSFAPFPPSPMTNKGILEYYLMDAASIISVLALGIKPGDHILDVCSAPGGKALTAIQTMNFENITCLEASESRYNRLCRTLDSYLPKADRLRRRISTRNVNALDLDLEREGYANAFDKVMVDVPCLSDRLSISEDKNNIFHVNRAAERNNLPILQTRLLLQGIKCLKPNANASLIYSTCTLNPMHNDAIIRSALSHLHVTHPDIKINIVHCGPMIDLLGPNFVFYRHKNHLLFNKPAEKNTTTIITPGNERKTLLGHLIIPNIGRNWGPLYFCKLQRVS